MRKPFPMISTTATRCAIPKAWRGSCSAAPKSFAARRTLAAAAGKDCSARGVRQPGAELQAGLLQLLLCIDERNVPRRQDARDVAHDDASDAFRRVFTVIRRPCNDRHTSRRRVIVGSVVTWKAAGVPEPSGTARHA